MWTSLPDDLVEALALPENHDIISELEDLEYITRRHHSRATYALGCHGPLCRKAERDRGVSRNKQRAALESRPYIPQLEKRAGRERDELLDKVVAWHLATLSERREASAS